MRISWSRRAQHDLRDLHDYIAKDSPFYAKRFVARIIAAVERLAEHPQIGRRVPEAGRDDIRELIFRGYRVVYLTRPDRLDIVTVIHGSRDLAGERPKPWEVV